MYVTLAQLADKPGATELAQVASTAHQTLVEPALMEASLRGTDRSAFAAGDVALADAAIARIVEIQVEVDETINAYIVRRVPSVPVLPAPSILTRIARAMVRYELHKDLIADGREHPIVRDYADKLRLLESIRDGKVTLGAADPVSATANTLGDVRISTVAPVFGRDANGAR